MGKLFDCVTDPVLISGLMALQPVLLVGQGLYKVHVLQLKKHHPGTESCAMISQEIFLSKH